MNLYLGQYVYVDNLTGRRCGKYMKARVVKVMQPYVILEAAQGHHVRYNLSDIVRITDKAAPMWVSRNKI